MLQKRKDDSLSLKTAASKRQYPVPIQQELIDIVAEDTPSQREAEDTARRILENRGDSIYTGLIWGLTNLRYEPDEAKKYWKDVLAHKEKISRRIGRNVGIRVAALDYFSNILGKTARPRVIDPDIIERLYRDATMDPLTGLSNRRHYRSRLAAEFSRSGRYKIPFVLVIFDIDDFKTVNDTQGHAVGDRVLQGVAEILRKVIRDADLAARWGGEEFVLLMPETQKHLGIVVADRIREEVGKSQAFEHVTVSGGVASYPDDGENEKILFSYADRALYRAKSEGKNKICLSPKERRAYPRLDTNLQVHLTSIPENGSSLKTATKNIGAAGIAFLNKEPFDIKLRVKGRIIIKDHRIEFLGRITRIEEEKNGQFLIGVEFVEITPEDRDLIVSCAHDEG